MAVHQIRLGSAWRLIAPATIIDLPAHGNVFANVPADSPLQLRRSFNRPSQLENDQCVKLAFTGLANGARVLLNGVLLGEALAAESGKAATTSFEIHKKLLPHNELRIEFADRSSFSNPNAVILESVTLEIDDRARDRP